MNEVVGVNIKNGGRIYYFWSNSLELTPGTEVIVNTEKGIQFGKVVTKLSSEPEKMQKVPLKEVVRIATDEDKKKYTKNIDDAKKALLESRKLVQKLKLEMRILDASFTFDRNQLLFNFLADQRVDFRELAKRLAQLYKTRIELRQIGVRDKAKEIGGLGPCGRFLCCNQFLTDFNSVSINMAKNQNLSLNPTKINGVCGRLLCCLNYEDEVYIELKRNLPNVGSFYETGQGRGKVIAVDVMKQSFTVDLKEKGQVVVEKV